MFATVGVNQTDRVLSPEEIGWADPDIDPQTAYAKTIEWMNKIAFSETIYPPHLIVK